MTSPHDSVQAACVSRSHGGDVSSQAPDPEAHGAPFDLHRGSDVDQLGECCQLLQSVLIFSLSLVGHLWEGAFRSCKYPIPHHTSLDLISIDGSWLKPSLLCWSKWQFSCFSADCAFIIWGLAFCSKEELLPTYYLMYPSIDL